MSNVKDETMPQGDRTGPSGMGPGTGRTFGYCYGFDTPGYVKGAGRGMGKGMGSGRGMGRGRGIGRGLGYGAHNAGFIQGQPAMTSVSKSDEIKILRTQAEALQRSQKEIEKRLSELEKGDE